MTDPYGNATVEMYPGNMTEDKKLMGHCVPGCVDYQFDDEFWEATMITEWDLVCENSWLKTLAKLLLFTGEDICTREAWLTIQSIHSLLYKLFANYKMLTQIFHSNITN